MLIEIKSTVYRLNSIDSNMSLCFYEAKLHIQILEICACVFAFKLSTLILEGFHQVHVVDGLDGICLPDGQYMFVPSFVNLPHGYASGTNYVSVFPFWNGMFKDKYFSNTLCLKAKLIARRISPATKSVWQCCFISWMSWIPLLIHLPHLSAQSYNASFGISHVD